MKRILLILILGLVATDASPATQDDAALEKALTKITTRRLFFFNSPPTLPCPTPKTLSGEMPFLLEEQRKRNPHDALMINAETATATSSLVYSATGYSRPATADLVTRVTHDACVIAIKASLAVKFPAPSLTDKRLVTITPYDSPFGWPSVFAVNVAITQLTLEACAGRSLEQIRAASDEMCRRRLRGGLDWPSAIVAGEDYAAVIFKAIANTPEFQTRLELAQKEWR